ASTPPLWLVAGDAEFLLRRPSFSLQAHLWRERLLALRRSALLMAWSLLSVCVRTRCFVRDSSPIEKCDHQKSEGFFARVSRVLSGSFSYDRCAVNNACRRLVAIELSSLLR